MAGSMDSEKAHTHIRISAETKRLLEAYRDDLLASEPGIGKKAETGRRAAIGGKMSLDRSIEVAVLRAWRAHNPEIREALEKLDEAEKAFIEAQGRRYRDAGGT